MQPDRQGGRAREAIVHTQPSHSHWCALAAFLLLKSSRLHKKRTQAAALAKVANYRDPACAARYNEEIIELMKRMAEIYEMNLEALNVEDRKRLKKSNSLGSP